MPIQWIRTDLNNNVYKYHFLNSNQTRLSWKNVLELVKNKDKNFLAVGKVTLDDANSKSFPYAWSCSPVSKSTLDRSFEFVVTKKSALESDKQDYSDFKTHIDNSSNQYVCNFSNLGRDATLVVPIPASGLNFNNISRFTKNASLKQQENFWEGVASQVSEELNKAEKTIWLNTHGTGVNYLHVRIDNSPKYYFFEDYKNPNYTPVPTPRTPEEKISANLDKICLDPLGGLANAELLKNKIYHNKNDFLPDSQSTQIYQVNIEGETINLKAINTQEIKKIKQAIITNIIIDAKLNNSNWKIEKEGSTEILLNNSGTKCWKWGFSQDEWKQVKNALNSPNEEQELKKWYNPLDYPLPWTITLVLSALLIVIIMTCWKRTKKRF